MQFITYGADQYKAQSEKYEGNFQSFGARMELIGVEVISKNIFSCKLILLFYKYCFILSSFYLWDITILTWAEQVWQN